MLDTNLIYKIDEIFKSNLWKIFNRDVPIGLKLNNGEIAYILFVETDITLELSIFYGKEAPYNLRNSLMSTDMDDLNIMKIRDFIISIESLNIIYFLDPEVSSNFVDISENNLLINNHYLVVSQNLFYSRINDLKKSELSTLKQCLDLLLSLEETLKVDPAFIEQTPCFLNGRGIIDLFEKKNNHYTLEKFAVPSMKYKQEIKPILTDEFQKGRLKRLERVDTLLVDLISSGERITHENGFSIPLVAFIVEEKTGFAFPFITEVNYRDNPDQFLGEFIDRLLELEFYPKKIKVSNERTYYFLEDLSKKLNIELEITDHLEELEEAEINYSHYLNMNDMVLDEEDFEDSDIYETYKETMSNFFDDFSLNFETEVFDPSFTDSEKEFINIVKELHGHHKSKPIEPNDKVIRFRKLSEYKKD